MQGVSDIGADARPRLAKRRVPQLLVDPDRLKLGPDTIAWKPTSGGGYLCLGIGDAAVFLCALDKDRDLAHKIDKAEECLGIEAGGGARFLRRLSIALDLVKDGFDSAEPRDNRGRWTNEGAAAATTATVTAASALDAAHVEWGPAAIAALRALAARVTAGPAVAFLSTIFIPTNRSTLTEGTVEGIPGHLAYRFDQDTGRLTITDDGPNGTREVLFSGKRVEGNVFRDAAGNVIGHDLGGSLVIDPDALQGYRSKAPTSTQTGTVAGSIAASEDNEPKLCPDPVPDRVNYIKPRAMAYQVYAGEEEGGYPLFAGLAVRLKNPATGRYVYFDNCQLLTGALIEAKGKGYSNLLSGKNTWIALTVSAKLLRQGQRQELAAQWRGLIWDAAEPDVAAHLRDLFVQNHLPIRVVYRPPPDSQAFKVELFFDEGECP